jgi:hypothetical protein
VKLAFIGAGVMGEAIIAGVLKKGLSLPEDITACDIVPDRREYLTNRYAIGVSDDPAKASSGSEVILLAVKPQADRYVDHGRGADRLSPILTQTRCDCARDTEYAGADRRRYDRVDSYRRRR